VIPLSSRDDDRAGDLLIREVDEELKQEQYALLWKRYGHWVAGAAVAIVAGVAGYQWWLGSQAELRTAEAARLSAAVALETQGKRGEAADAFALLAKEGKTGAALVSQFRRAEMLAAGGDVAGAVAVYAQVASGGAPVIYRELAVIKEAMLTVDSAEPADLRKRLEPLTAATGAWRHSAMELLALLARRQGDDARARELYQRLADDASAPQGLRARAAEMLAALGAPERAKG
jgi:hypothetical protein